MVVVIIIIIIIIIIINYYHYYLSPGRAWQSTVDTGNGHAADRGDKPIPDRNPRGRTMRKT